MEEFNEFNQRLYETSIFVGKMLLAGLFFHLVLFVNPDTSFFQTVFASLMNNLLNFAGLEASHSGIRIITGEAVYVIVQDCLGWKSMAVFLALIYASTSRALENLNYIIGGLTVLVLANIVRVFSTIYLSEIGLISFEVIHGVLWRWSLTIVVLVLWFYWLKNVKDKEKFERRLKARLKALKNR